MSKTIYEEALDGYSHVKAIVQNKKSHLTWEEEVHHLANITRALQQAQKQEKLLELYHKLAEHRLIVIHYLLDEIMDLRYFDTIKDGIDYIMVKAKNYGNEDIKIVEDIEKQIKELVYE